MLTFLLSTLCVHCVLFLLFVSFTLASLLLVTPRFVGEYRKCLAVPPSESSASDNGAMSEPINDDKTVTDKMPAVPLPPSTHNKELRYTD